jgi:glyoxalase family protein
MTLTLPGLHHVTAVTAKIRENRDFYTRVLGMRLVKRSVNQDDVRAYHLFYADALGSPGTDLTFFDWPLAAPERSGNHSISRTGLRVATGSLGWWAERLAAEKVRHGGIVERDGRQVLDFMDPEGQRLSLTGDDGPSNARAWEGSPVPAEHQVRGLGPIHFTIPRLAPTREVLAEVLNMRSDRQYPVPGVPQHQVHVFESGEGGPGGEVHVHVRPDIPAARPGAGGVHHVAFRVPDFEQHAEWEERFRRLGLRTSGIVERYYFRSIYYREPNGILIELATDGPGFAADEDPAHLGERLALPPFLEGRRADIEAHLKPID